MVYDPVDQFWQPNLDAVHLILGPAKERDRVVGLSKRYSDYLRLLVRS